jgi:predicted metal-dependent HD superfamily phosphohydrolase
MDLDNSIALNHSHLPTIEAYVRGLFVGLPTIYRFHTLDHTLAVVAASKEIAKLEGLPEHEQLLVEASAWFHDVGYLRSLAEHETMSAFRSLLYLSRMGIHLDDIERIEQCILVTKLGSKPMNDMQKVLCDADMWHLTCPEFQMWSGRLRKEWGAMKGLVATDAEWIQNNLNFMRGVKFHTHYAKEIMQLRLAANIQTLEDMLQKIEANPL